MDMQSEISELIDRRRIQQRIRELGQSITREYKGKELVVVGVLKGSFLFLADLVRQIDLPQHIDFIQASSYGDARSSSGRVRILKDLDHPITDCHVILVEDIVDSGLTLRSLMDLLWARKPASIEVATLLAKPEKYQVDAPLRYVGFEIEDRFVVGMGMDYRGQYRDLDYIGVLNEPI